MTEREKIISLARECNVKSLKEPRYHMDIYELTGQAIEAFYKAAQNEAYASCINACIQAEQESGYAKSQLSDEEYIAKAVASGAVYQAKKLQGVIANMKEQS